MSERMITYLDDLADCERDIAAIREHLNAGLVITPSEAGCLLDAALALKECVDLMDAG